MMEPGRVVYPIGDLHEQTEILSAQVQRFIGAAEIETLVFSELAFGIFACVPLGLLRRGMNGDDLRRLASFPPSKQGFASRGLFGGKLWRIDRQRATEGLNRLSYLRSNHE